MSSITNIVSKLQENREVIREDDREEKYQAYLKKMKDNATYKKMDALCTKYGYQLRNASVYTRANGSKRIEIDIYAHSESYHAEIYYDIAWGANEGEFKIQTIAHGSLKIEEYEKFLKGCQDSHDLVVELNKIDLYTLYDPGEDDIE